MTKINNPVTKVNNGIDLNDKDFYSKKRIIVKLFYFLIL